MSHNFAESLAFSHRAEDLPFWLEVYTKAFPSMIGMHSHRADGEHQRNGIDRSLLLENSKQILVDEKVRKEDYGDILLERWSDLERKVPGWVVKPLRADYIAYAILPTSTCYLLPVALLQAAWRTHGRRWMGQCKTCDAHNQFGSRSWVTRSFAVPTAELLGAMGDHMRVSFAPMAKCT